MVLRAGILMLDFGLVLARDLAQRRGCRVRDVWFDLRTARTMRQLATSVVGSIWSADAPIAYEMLTERRLEMRFGRIRSCYDNAQMTVGDYLRASCFVSQCEKKKWIKTDQTESPEKLHQNTFCSIASQAFQSVVKLSSMTSGRTRAELQSMFNLSLTEHYMDEEEEEDMIAGDKPVWNNMGIFLDGV